MTSVADRPEVADSDEEGRRRTARRSSPGTGAWVRVLWESGYYALLGLVSTLVALGFLGMFSRPLGIPLVYDGDALSGGAQFKGTMENGWYELNPSLGAPFGQNLHDFPTADNMQFVLARVLGLFTDQWAVAYNLAYLSTFTLTALAAAWFLRVVGLGRVTAFAFGLLYAFTPYHFIHSQPHLALSMLFVVPLFSALVLRAMSDRPVWGRRGEGAWWNPLSWATPTTVGTLAILGVTGSTSSYYAVFGLIMMSVAMVVLLVGRRLRRALGAVVSMIGLMAVMVINMAPDILYARSMPVSPAAFSRQPLESEIYALKFASLVFPVPWHRIGALSRFRLNYDGTFPQPSESPVLGLVSTIGFLFLLAMPVVLMLLRRPASTTGIASGTQRHLAVLTLVAFLFGTIGGLGTLFALFVSSDIRAWNRIVVYIALFGLTATALLLERGLGWARGRFAARRPSLARRWWAVTVATCSVVAVVGLFDQAAPATWTSPPSRHAEQDWRNDEAYVSAIEDKVPAGTSIFELPAMAFPESLPIWDMHDYDPIRPYLHSDDLRWSYGGIKGRPRSDWQQVVTTLPPLRMVTALAASGFGGVHLDRYGYPGHDAGAVEDALRSLCGPPVVSPDGRFAFYDLRAFAEQQESAYPAAQLATIERHTLKGPLFYWQSGFTGPPVADAGHLVLVGKNASPTGVIDNPGAPAKVKLTFSIRPVDADLPTRALVTWPDGKRQEVTLREATTEVTHTFVAGRGRSTLTVAGYGTPRIDLVDLVLRDPVMSFDLAGRAAEVAAQDDVRRQRERRSDAAAATPTDSVDE